jgi:hypothetical protein
LIRLVLLVCATGLAALTAAAAAPSTSLREVLDALGRCWQAPAGTVGSEMTLALSLNRSGEIQGSPRITYSHLTGDVIAQKRFLASVLAGLARCTPVTLSDELGQAIAGRPIRIRFRSAPGERKT